MLFRVSGFRPENWIQGRNFQGNAFGSPVSVDDINWSIGRVMLSHNVANKSWSLNYLRMRLDCRLRLTELDKDWNFIGTIDGEMVILEKLKTFQRTPFTNCDVYSIKRVIYRLNSYWKIYEFFVNQGIVQTWIKPLVKNGRCFYITYKRDSSQHMMNQVNAAVCAFARLGTDRAFCKFIAWWIII